VQHLANVKLFSHNECRHGVAVRRFLTEHDIPFEEADIERTPGALDELVELTGSARHVPVVVVNGQMFIDFDESVAATILQTVSKSKKAS
jgi:glutaredoxin